LDEAVAHHRRAIELAPGESKFHSALVYLLNFHPDYDAPAVAAEHRTWAARHADPLTAQFAPHANDRTIDRRLRIGYVSPYFASHAVNVFTEPILTSHDRTEIEVFCYSDVHEGDEATHRLRDSVEHWRETSSLDDQQLSEAVRDDGIDILVDLTGHIGDNRLMVFARKPAPIQVTYIGYQNTTGMVAMDYRLTDVYCDPPGLTEALHTEQLVRLPRTFFCYLPSPDAPEVDSLPALRLSQVTFGAFNNFTKVTPQVLETWAQILGRVPQARLVLLADEGPTLHRHISEIFESQHVGPERFEVVERLPRAEYLARIGRVDIALDPFPFNGHTTTCDCLWQGVPVVTLSGQTYASRFGGSGLMALGLEELIARSVEQYVAIAAGLATDLNRLAELRRTLRERMAASPLLDHRSFTRNLEIEYRRMWATWCNS
jgi:predicted O-linked N-acetylglucosamine transferase (SPINDLY family)